jgi:2-C-methyl-D-erythritol 4-phosphate cytidylyltransferase
MEGTDKLAAEVGGRPLLAWTLAAIASSPVVKTIVVVAAPDRVAAIRDADWLPAKVVEVTAGARGARSRLRQVSRRSTGSRPGPRQTTASSSSTTARGRW